MGILVIAVMFMPHCYQILTFTNLFKLITLVDEFSLNLVFGSYSVGNFFVGKKLFLVFT